jgi:DNA-binding response OmpR family regulator
MSTILTVDDEPGIRALLVDSLADSGHEVVEAADGEAALQTLEDRPFDLMLLDLRMPGRLDGMAVLRNARARWPEMQVIVLTAYGTVADAVEAMRLGAFDFMEKPLHSPDAVRRLAARAIAWRGHTPVPRPTAEETTSIDAASSSVNPPVPSRIRAFLSELRRRHVYQHPATYAAIALAALQVGQLVLPVLPLPGWSYAGLVGVCVLGLPVVLTLGWIYDISLTRTGGTTACPDR